MGKQPSFQFYPNDWLRDMLEYPLDIRGAWITILCKLWYSDTRGKLTKTLSQWAAILGVSEEETKSILSFLKQNKIAKIPKLPLGITEKYKNITPNITVISRRMEREEKERKNNALRQRRYYTKHKPNAKPNGIPNENLTTYSSSSSSIINNNTNKDVLLFNKKKHTHVIKKDESSVFEKKKYGDFVELTATEYNMLIKDYGESRVKAKIEAMNYHIGSTDAYYRSHYYTLRKWFLQDTMKTGAVSDGEKKKAEEEKLKVREKEYKERVKKYKESLSLIGDVYPDEIDRLKENIDDAAMSAFIRPLRVVGEENGEIVLFAEKSDADWIRSNYVKNLNDAFGDKVKITSKINKILDK